MKQFEYKVEKVKSILTTGLEAELDKFGQEGWEMCGMRVLSSTQYTIEPALYENEMLVIFKRQIYAE